MSLAVGASYGDLVRSALEECDGDLESDLAQLRSAADAEHDRLKRDNAPSGMHEDVDEKLQRDLDDRRAQGLATTSGVIQREAARKYAHNELTALFMFRDQIIAHLKATGLMDANGNVSGPDGPAMMRDLSLDLTFDTHNPSHLFKLLDEADQSGLQRMIEEPTMRHHLTATGNDPPQPGEVRESYDELLQAMMVDLDARCAPSKILLEAASKETAMEEGMIAATIFGRVTRHNIRIAASHLLSPLSLTDSMRTRSCFVLSVYW